MKKEELIAFIYEWQHFALSRKGIIRLSEKDIYPVIGSKSILLNGY